MSNSLSDQEILRELSNLKPDECLKRIAAELKSRLHCETACILFWHELYKANGQESPQVIVTGYDAGMPKLFEERYDHAEIYRWGEGITGGYIFEKQNSIRARIVMSKKAIYDDEIGRKIRVKNTNWHNMQRFADECDSKDFKSLLGVPLIVKNHRIGVVKLINKLDDNGKLTEHGFDSSDLERVRSFLSTIELVIEAKTNEKQIQHTLALSTKTLSADFNYESLLNDLAASCAEILNLRICIIRVSDQAKLEIRGNSLGPAQNVDFENFTISNEVVRTHRAYQLEGKVFKSLDLDQLTFKSKLPNVIRDSNYAIKTIVVYPVVYQERVIATIEGYTFLPEEFSTAKLNSLHLYATLISTIYQRKRSDDAIAGLSQSFGVLKDSSTVYREVINLIEAYLGTSTVSIWERRALDNGGFDFELVRASSHFDDEYRKNNITRVSNASMTARIAQGHDIVHFGADLLKREPLEHAEFIKKNRLVSLSMVPIAIGGQTIAVVDIFYPDDRQLIKQNESFLRLLATKTASALWNKRLALSFRAIAEAVLSARDVGTILGQIAEVARLEFFADVVMFFEYDSRARDFKSPNYAGKLYAPAPVHAGKKEGESNFLTLMLSQDRPLYFPTIESYKTFCENTGDLRLWRPNDFWHREELASMAAVLLADGRNNPVAALFFNYRTPFTFDESTQKVIESFAFQAASAIVSTRLKGLGNQEVFREQMVKDLLPQLSLAINLLNFKLSPISELIKTGEQSIRAELIGDFTPSINALRDLHKTVSYYRDQIFLDAPEQHYSVNFLIEDVLAALENTLSTSGIRLQVDYEKAIPDCVVDYALFVRMLHLVILILLDARTPNSSLVIGTRFQRNNSSIEVFLKLTWRVTDDVLDRILKQSVNPAEREKPRPRGRLEAVQVLAELAKGEISLEKQPSTVGFRITFVVD